MRNKLLGFMVILALLLMSASVVGAQDDEGDEFDIMSMQDDDRFSWDVMEEFEGLDFEGETVTIFGAFVDVGARRFREALKPFEEQTGIDVEYEGSGDFESLINIRVEGGDPPDIAAFPQPGLFEDLSNNIVPVSEEIETAMSEQYNQGWVDLGTVEGDLKAITYRANVKSLVWYNPEAFEAAGYEVPETWDGLMELSDQIVEDGSSPWCVGIESSGATGWVITDWVEDILLRTAPTEIYDQWVNHEIPFDHPEVVEALDIVGDIVKNEDYVYGGTEAVLTTPFGDSPAGLFAEPPNCYLHRQASFIADFLPDDVEIAEDGEAWAFYLPGIEEEYGQPMLTAGDLFAPFSDDPATMATLRYLTTPLAQEIWAAQGGFVAPNQEASLEVYPTELDRFFAEVLREASVTRFDASDMMPGAIGAGEWWSAATSWVADELTTEEALAQVEETWANLGE